MRTSTRQGEGGRAGQAPPASRRETWFDTPYGVGRLGFSGDVPLELDLPEPGRTRPEGTDEGHLSDRQREWVARVERYFAGEPVSFDLDVRAHCRARGFTAFETDVYAALAQVPYGHAVSYRDLAHAAGRPNAYRAVGTAMSHNALPVILPCHRVIKNDGRPGLYGEDPTWKTRLLELEGTLRRGATKVVMTGRGQR